ncbi:hypothetical protein JQ633_06700 [Bradyrhizobium tropiciagri]|uniref:hypothetical protein n=1 Tax=Bradyrhizobium tropiciagri TaxID=312253 RepID=UPI001BA68949|nr:hypothetical protein [Bradyrhizobium tropiciagri]MBR0870039.1 hypothetical protein [Bradyrhizobium tropiciagri]
MNRHQRRSDLRAFRRATTALRTYLVSPDDAALDEVPLLRQASQSWVDGLAERARHCIICASWVVDREHVGALLLSTPDIPRPSTVGTCAICKPCWNANLPVDALERACANVLRPVVPGGAFEPLDPAT